ncbi:MAG: ABC transporter permease [Bacteroidota bacterium]
MLFNYLKTAWRIFLRNKAHALINIAGLSIGIACTIVISIFIRYESSFDSFHRQSGNTFRVVQDTKYPDQTLHWESTCYPLAEALRNDFGDFAHVTQAAGPTDRFFAVDRGDGEVVRFEERYVLFVDTAYAHVFDLEWLAGNPNEALKLKNSVVLTQVTAEKAFGIKEDHKEGYASMLGKTILLNGKDPLIVTGVVKNAPGNTVLRYNMLVPYEFFKENNPYQANNWEGNYGGSTFVVLKDNDEKVDLEQKIATWKKKYQRPEVDSRIAYFFQPLKEIHNETMYGNASGSYTMSFKVLRAAGAVGIFILIIAAVNFINLSTARAITRSKEVGIRKVMGSSRMRLIIQFVYEHSLLIVVTLLISVGLSQFALRQFNEYLSSINMQLTFGWSDVGLVVIIGVSVILLAAIYPAIVLSSFKPIEAVKNKITQTRQNIFSLRRGLIVFQFAVVQLLIIATIVVARQIHHFNSTDLGFETTSIISMPVPDDQKLDAFRNRLRANGNVRDVTFGSNAPVGVDGSYGTSYRLPQQPEAESQESLMVVTDIDYIPFFDLELIAGRNFTVVKDHFDEFIINEKVARSKGWTPEQALGNRLVINEGEATVVGVVKDFQNQSLRSQSTPDILMNWNAILSRAYVRVNNITPATIAELEGTWKEFAPEKVFSHVVLTDALEYQYGIETMVFHGFTIFASLSIFIGCLGLFGLSSFMAVRRAKEIGIRKVLGASLSNILIQFSREFVWMVVIGFAVASPLAWLMMDQWLQEFAHRIDIEWWMFAGGGVLALTIAVLTVSFHSLQVGTANPVDSLRNE